jgi:hypothetical protein
MSTLPVSIDLPPTPQAPPGCRPVLRTVPVAGVRPPPRWTPSGIGLVEVLADRWGVEDRHHRGTRVWFGLDDLTHHNPAHDLEIDRVGASWGSVADVGTEGAPTG